MGRSRPPGRSGAQRDAKASGKHRDDPEGGYAPPEAAIYRSLAVLRIACGGGHHGATRA